MTKTETAFLYILRAVLHEEKPADPGLTGEEWAALLRLAEAHKLLPLILDAACGLPSYRNTAAPVRTVAARPESLPIEGKASAQPTDELAERQPAASAQQNKPETPYQAARRKDGARSSAPPAWKEMALEQVARQAIQENEFLNLILALQARGLEPVVMKGCVCRALWPKPLLRPSVDDDLLIPDDQAAAYHTALLAFGMTADEPDVDLDKAWELSYHKPNSPLYIELHKRLFDPESDTFLNFNAPFKGALDRAVPVQIQDVTLKTLAPTDHLLFLILHAFKHFLFSGFGLRIVADVCLYARQYTEEIDFGKISGICAELRCDRFTAALFRIGEKYLGVSKPMAFALPDVDESALLEDVLAAGLVGADIDRLHSANITLGAVADENQGKTRSGGLAKTLFPSAKKLSGRYPYLETKPWLLPVAWASRVGTYFKERGKYGEQSPAASLRIGKERVELLKTYGVIERGE